MSVHIGPTREDRPPMTARQIEKFIAVANYHLQGEEISRSQTRPDFFALWEIGEKGRLIETFDLERLIKLSGIPDMPEFWPDHLKSEWPPTYIDEEDQTRFNEKAYWALEDREYQRLQAEAARGKRYPNWEAAEADAIKATEVRGKEWEPVVLSDGSITIRPVAAAEAIEVWLGTETDPDTGDVLYDIYGYKGADPREDQITRRDPRVIKDPKQSLDNLIAVALGKVDNWAAAEGTEDYSNIQRARKLFDFKNQPTDAERLRLAMDIAQSPSDYMTLVSLYTGAISSTGVGGKVAPLMPYLQQMAQKFFLNVPGINDMTPDDTGQASGPWLDLTGESDILVPDTPETTTPVTDTPETTTPVTDTYADQRAAQAAQIWSPTGIVGEGGRFYDTETRGWESPAAFEERGRTASYLIESPWPSEADTPVTDATKEYTGIFDSPIVGWEKPRFFPETDEELGGSGLDQLGEGGIESFQQGGVVPGMLGEPKLIQAEGGEIVIPNAARSPYTKSLFGGTFIPRRETFGKFLTDPGTRGQIPSMPTVQAAQFRFRSPQTIRNMTPLQRSLFQASTQPMFGVPYEDWRMQERLATGAGGPGRPRIQFRRPSFVRG